MPSHAGNVRLTLKMDACGTVQRRLFKSWEGHYPRFGATKMDLEIRDSKGRA